MIQAVLFDFNGIIINDEPLHQRAYTETLKAEGINLTEADYMASLGMDDRRFVEAAYGRAGRPLDDKTRERIIKRETELHRAALEENLPLFPGVETFAKALARHFTLGIVSMSRREQVEYALERAAMDSVFSIIISAEDVRACKPDPECYNTGFLRIDEFRRRAGHTSLSPEECLVIEDSPPGIRAGRAAGMRTLGVTNTVKAEELRAAGAEVVTANLADWTDDTVRHVFSEMPATGGMRAKL
jgi:HAD superfamily hydrolase (TIGR01509 family)